MNSFYIAVASVSVPQGYDLNSDQTLAQTVIGLLLLAVIIGVVYNLWRTTSVYGGIIGQGIRRVGLGIVFLVVEATDRVVQTFGNTGVISGIFPSPLDNSAHDILFMLGLAFVALGFIKFSQALKG